jgi:hypothetical protein
MTLGSSLARSAVCFVSLALLAGCPDEPPGEDAGPPPPTVEDLAEAWADLIARCAGFGPESFLQELEPELAPLAASYFEDEATANLTRALENDKLIVDEDGLAACIDYLESAECGADIETDACDGVVTGAVENGDACAGDGECVSGYCAGNVADGCGVCERIREGGETCRVVDGFDVSIMRCEEGYYCDRLGGSCELQLGEGANCPNGDECSEGTTCVAEGLIARRCRTLVHGEAEGDECTAIEAEQTCGALLQTGLRCQGAEGEVGVCTAITIVDEGGTCDGRTGREDVALWCKRGLTDFFCDVPDGGDTGICRARPGVGESCLETEGQCTTDGICQRNDTFTEAECVAAPEAGDACVDNAVGSDGCNVPGAFLECDEEAEGGPVCVPENDEPDEEPVCDEPVDNDAGPADGGS